MSTREWRVDQALQTKNATSAVKITRITAKNHSGFALTGPIAKLSIIASVVRAAPFLLQVHKADRRSTVHRPVHLDAVSIKTFDKAGEVSLRLSKADQAEFLETYDSRVPAQYGKDMPDFAVVPDALLRDLDALRPWFVRSWDFVGTLEPR